MASVRVRGSMVRRIFKTCILCCAFLLVCSSLALAAIRLKVLAINASEQETQKVPVRYDLPPEIRREDILDSGTMSIEFDSQKNIYYVFKNVTLAPKETVIFQVVIGDKWTIPPDEIDELKNKVTEKLKVLENTDQYQTAKMLAGTINGKLDDVVRSQNDVGPDVERKIGLARANRQLLKELSDEALSLDYLSVRSKNMEEAGTVRYMVEAENPTDEEIETTITSELPSGIEPEFIVNAQGFEVHYNVQTDQYFLSKTEKLAPKERKRFEIEIKDMWKYPDSLLDAYKTDTEKAIKVLNDTKFKNLSLLLQDEIIKQIEQIRTAQSSAATLNDRIALYSVNKEREKRIQLDISKLKNMLAELVQSKDFFTVLKMQKPKAELKFAELPKKQAVPKVQVWTVVLYLVIFLSVLTAVVMIFWFQRVGKADARKYNKVEKPKLRV